MEVETKKIVQSVTFNENEKKFMTYLADTMEEECKNHASCDYCPFDKARWGGACEDFIEILRSFANEGRLEV